MVEDHDPSVGSGFDINQEEVESALLSGERADELRELFGAEEYEDLRKLSQEAAAATLDKGRVLILPGTMGSQLINKGGGFLGSDYTIWFDPFVLASGMITKLALPGSSGDDIRVHGVLPLIYTRLWLDLWKAGYKADFYPYDWRQSITTLGTQLNDYINRQPENEISLVCHSMGGMVGRVALKQSSSSKIKQMIMLGTPNFGSFLVPRAIRGTAKSVKDIAAVDFARGHDADFIAKTVIGTLPGMYDMMPAPEVYSKVNLYEATEWPVDSHPLPRQELLNTVQSARQSMADADKKFSLIAGVGLTTKTDLDKVNGEFKYEETVSGDGTVPVKFAEMAGAKNYYADKVEHTKLASNTLVIKAVIEILNTGTATALPEHWSPPSTAASQIVSEFVPSSEPFDSRPLSELSASEIREISKTIILQQEIIA